MIIKSLNALGVFGGASLNSVELALINTDGLDVKEFIKSQIFGYPEELCLDLRELINKHSWTFAELENSEQVQNVRDKISMFYADCIKEFIADEKVDCIGVDGLTIFNDAENKCSYQLEDGHIFAKSLQRSVITHFHKADLLAGGQAAPLVPAFVDYLVQAEEKPLLFIDIEAVSSLIYVGENGEITAFDCAPGLAMIEDWTFRHANMLTDYNGGLGIIGKPDQQIIEFLLKQKILQKQPPKSLDISDFSAKKEHLEGLSLENGAASATAFIAEAIYQAALDFLPAIPHNIIMGGEGVKNPTLCRFIKQNFAPREVKGISAITEFSKAIGAQATAFNTVRRIYGLPITFPKTTGVNEPITGGEIYENY